jgi:hypothetical protein
VLGLIPVSINNDDAGPVAFEDVEDSRRVRYTAGARIQRDYSETLGALEDAEIYLSWVFRYS